MRALTLFWCKIIHPVIAASVFWLLLAVPACFYWGHAKAVAESRATPTRVVEFHPPTDTRELILAGVKSILDRQELSNVGNR